MPPAVRAEYMQQPELKGNTRLCIARALTTPDEWVRTLTISQWKQQSVPQLDKFPTLFLFQAAA